MAWAITWVNTDGNKHVESGSGRHSWVLGHAHSGLVSAVSAARRLDNQSSCPCIIPESRTGDEPPAVDLTGLLDRAHRHHALVMLDEILAGVRLLEASAQRDYGVSPDVSTLGKAIGNGFALMSALEGRRELLECGGSNNAGERVFNLSMTHAAETHSLAATMAVMQEFVGKQISQQRDEIGLRDRVVGGLKQHGLDAHVLCVGTRATLSTHRATVAVPRHRRSRRSSRGPSSSASSRFRSLAVRP